MSKQNQDFVKWMRQQLFRDRTRPLERFELRHAGPGNKGQEVDTFPIMGSMDQAGLLALADDIMARAQTDADSLGNKLQRYAVVAIETDKSNGPRFAFRLRGEGDDEEEGDGEEPPTEKGLLQQTMRHNEAMMRMMMQGFGTTVSHLQRQLEASTTTIAQLTEQRQAALMQVEAAASQQHDRDLQLMLESGKQERQAALFKQLEAALPVVINKMAGRGILPEKEASVLRPFMDSLTEDQVRSIAQNLRPEQQVALFNIYKEMKKGASQEQLPAGASQEQANKNGVH